jgi:hypothetical protein
MPVHIALEIAYVKKIIPDAYHGTSRSIAERILIEGFIYGHDDTKYLGDGVYFFEASERNAKYWAKSRYPSEPCVIQAVIDLGRCLDLNNQEHRRLLRRLYKELLAEMQRRSKDKASFECEITDAFLIEFVASQCKLDTVRALQVKPDRGTLFEGSRLMIYQDLVISVRNTDCILQCRILERG